MSDRCPLCGREALFVFYERHGVPVYQNLPLPTADAARAVTRGDLRLACCSACGFISNLAFSDELLRYGAGYENDQTCSPLFDRYVEGLVSRIVDDCAVRRRDVVEVGCGRGTFLRRVCARGDNRGVGFDPAYVGEASVDEGRVRFTREYYGPQQAAVPADAVICRHVIEHVPSPPRLLDAVRGALAGAARADAFFETPDVEWILDGVVVQDFFYEHCSYFSAESLAYCFRRAGFDAVTVERVFGDQYLWMHAIHRSGAAPSSEAPPAAARTVAAARRFQTSEAALHQQIDARLRALRVVGPIAIWGAGAKGVTFLNQLDAGCGLVDCVVDINPRKQGLFVPGTGHAIVAPEALAARGVRNVIVMNPNYAAEIRGYVEANHLPIRVHTETNQ
ncbi:MAG: S-adenosylmethionine-dependent methyltransferase [bacterium]|nr:S-adenosylmethionine-dependent methyltransferase [bacterium]